MPPKILQPADVSMGGINAQLIGDVDPAAFPNGVELTAFRPGQLQPVGTVQLPPGCLVFAIPPEQAQHFRSAMRKQTAGANPLAPND